MIDFREFIKWVVITILVVILLSAGSGYWKQRKEAKQMEAQIELQQIELNEYEKEIKSLRQIAIDSRVEHNELAKFDSIRASFKRHLNELRHAKE